ncbi:hypothetical protein J4204_03015 [Candidatus Woesearchaeota archaeon]|nr:hypothetical protein [Candidatus Woesearchaeota archaeon]
MSNQKCKYCGSEDLSLRSKKLKQLGSNKMIMAEIKCNDCGRSQPKN